MQRLQWGPKSHTVAVPYGLLKQMRNSTYSICWTITLQFVVLYSSWGNALVSYHNVLDSEACRRNYIFNKLLKIMLVGILV